VAVDDSVHGLPDVLSVAALVAASSGPKMLTKSILIKLINVKYVHLKIYLSTYAKFRREIFA